MNKTRFTLRTGLCITIIGLTILLANVATQGAGDAISNMSFSIGPNEKEADLAIPLNYGGHEIRLIAPRAFEGVLYILDYEGIRELAEDNMLTPIMNETFKGSTLIDFTINRRGPYIVMIESSVSTDAQVTAALLEKGTLRQDYIWDSLIIIAVGVIISILATTPRIGHLRRSKHKRNSGSNSR